MFTFATRRDPQERAKHNLNNARLRAIPAGELWALLKGGNTAMRTSPGFDGLVGGEISATQSLHISGHFVGETESDEGEGWCGSGPCRWDNRLASTVAACRERSRPAYLHFPHLELMFLFFAFEGAVASQTRVLRSGYDAGPAVFLLALVALVSQQTKNAQVCRGNVT